MTRDIPAPPVTTSFVATARLAIPTDERVSAPHQNALHNVPGWRRDMGPAEISPTREHAKPTTLPRMTIGRYGVKNLGLSAPRNPIRG